MKTIAVSTQKGGVGKTTTAVNLAAGLAARGFRTLLIDLDPQCNSTITYLPPDQITTTLADVLVQSSAGSNPVELADAIYNTEYENLDIVPGHIRLALLDQQSQFNEQYKLKDALAKLPANEYDFALIDCLPSLGLILTQALLAADSVIVPVAAEYFPLEGVNDLLNTIQGITRGNPHLSILGFVITKFDARNSICKQAHEKVLERVGDLAFETVIRTNVKLQTAPAYRQSIYEHARASHGAEDYINLVDEVLARLNVKRHLKIVSGQSA